MHLYNGLIFYFIFVKMLSHFFNVLYICKPVGMAREKFIALRVEDELYNELKELAETNRLCKGNLSQYIRFVLWRHVSGVRSKRAREQRLSSGDRPTLPNNQPQKTVKYKGPKVSRNAPCPCGSGKKFKKCCGRNG
jgi:hypothetical protein